MLILLGCDYLLDLIKHTLASNLFISGYCSDIAASFFFVNVSGVAFRVVVCSVVGTFSPY